MQWDTKSIIERTKAEVIEDVLDGRIPATVRDASELHDFVDANCYAGLCDDECPLSTSEEDVDIINDAMDAISGWLHRGGLLDALRRIHPDAATLDSHHKTFHDSRQRG